MNDGPGGGYGKALSDAVAAAGPSRVYEIYRGPEFLYAFDQQIGINACRPGKEGRAEAGRKGGLVSFIYNKLLSIISFTQINSSLKWLALKTKT